MIFITTGSQKFQFNRLLKKIDELIEEGIITEEVFAQIGCSDYVPQNYKFVDFLNRDEFASNMDKCDIVITHGGTGVIITAVKKGKRVIAVPRLKEFDEHVDDHQVQLLKEFDEMNIICACYDLDKLAEDYRGIRDRNFRPYVSNTKTLIEDIENFLNE